MSLICSGKKPDVPALCFTIPFTQELVIDCMPFENRVILRKKGMPPAQSELKEIPALPSLPVRLQRLSILPNNRCNFHCSYCYAARSRETGELAKETMFKAIETFFALPERKDLSASFLGGGEPLLSWETVKAGILFIRSISTDIPINIVSNGSIVTDEMICFFLENRVTLTISFEVLEDIQNYQRGAYAVVDANIRRLLSENIPLKIRSILTDRNVHRMEEMAAVIAERYPGITKWLAEPVSAWSCFDDPADAERFWRDYRQSLDSLERSGILKDIPWNSLLKRFFKGSSTCYCDGEFVVMPSGSIGLCHRVSSPQEKLGGEWLWGFFKDGKYELNPSRAERFYQLPEKMKESCSVCPAFACCGGNCRVMTKEASDEYIKSQCSFIRECFFDHIRAICTRSLKCSPLPDTENALPRSFKLYD